MSLKKILVIKNIGVILENEISYKVLAVLQCKTDILLYVICLQKENIGMHRVYSDQVEYYLIKIYYLNTI